MSPVHLPLNLSELLAARAGHPQALVYAGGTDLLVRLRRQEPANRQMICLERVAELQEIRQSGDEIFIGAAATVQQVLDNPLIQENCPVLIKALSHLGSPPIRHMATLGGNLVTASPAGDSLPALYCLDARVELASAGGSRRVSHLGSPPIRHMATLGGNLVTASPAGDSLPALYCLDARVEIASASGSRRVAVSDFIQGPGKVDLLAEEVVTGIILPARPGYNLQHFEKVGKRKALAISVASLAACLSLSPEGRVTDARLAWGSVGPTVVTCPPAEQALQGRTLDEPTLLSVAALAREAVRPIDDLRATAGYRRQVAGNLVLRLMAN
jgi:xanthine dehydrogenase FAD-binding subunit